MRRESTVENAADKPRYDRRQDVGDHPSHHARFGFPRSSTYYVARYSTANAKSDRIPSGENYKGWGNRRHVCYRSLDLKEKVRLPTENRRHRIGYRREGSE